MLFGLSLIRVANASDRNKKVKKKVKKHHRCVGYAALVVSMLSLSTGFEEHKRKLAVCLLAISEESATRAIRKMRIRGSRVRSRRRHSAAVAASKIELALTPRRDVMER